MNKKSNLFGDQSASTRLREVSDGTKQTVRQSYGGFYVKNETQKNSINSALSRVRAGGSVVPMKTRHRPIYPLQQCPELPHTTGYQLCSAWPSFGGVDNTNRRLSPFLGSQTGVFKWITEINTNKYVVTSTPIIDEYGNMYVAYTYKGTPYVGFLAAFDKNGKLRSTFTLPGTGPNVGDYINNATPVIGNDGTLYFGTNYGNFYALSVFGRLKWSFTDPTNSGQSVSIQSPVMIGLDETIYFATSNNTSGYGSVYALNVNGQVKSGWPFRTQTHIQDSTHSTTRMYIRKGMALAGNSVLVVGQGIYGSGSYGMLFCLSSEGGLNGYYNTIGLRNNAVINSLPVLSQDQKTVYLGIDNQATTEFIIVALDAFSGVVKWTYANTSFHFSNQSIALDGEGNLYFSVNVNNKGTLFSLDSIGHYRWQYTVGSAYYTSSLDCTPVVGKDGLIYFSGSYVIRTDTHTVDGLGNEIYTYATYGEMYALKPNGVLAWNVTLGAGYTPLFSPMIDGNNTVYTAALLSGSDGYSNLYAFN